ncbi:MAG: hypothetical protein FWD82_10205 [Defluviitaleaceae bacterium]|nr:hypothetical protein [Defluviitaleaceae bacterium]
MSDITTLKVQRDTKAKIEDVLPHFLDGAVLESAWSFVTFLRLEKMNPIWAGVHNAWRANNKGKALFYIRLGKEWIRNTENVKWVIILYLNNMDSYAEKIISEGWQNIVWDDLHYCRKPNCPYGCNLGKINTILGKEFFNLCPTFINKVNFVNPGEKELKIIKKLIEFEREARGCKR